MLRFLGQGGPRVAVLLGHRVVLVYLRVGTFQKMVFIHLCHQVGGWQMINTQGLRSTRYEVPSWLWFQDMATPVVN